MAKLKPLGSEKLEGTDKLKRIMEIANYNIGSSSIKESTSDYSINLVDGATYHIVKEKSGYIIKKGLNESDADYIEPMKNRKYYSSYGQALKRLNLLVKEVNTVNEFSEGTSLFGEQKKFVLKTPKATAPAPVMEPEIPAVPAPVPSPELPAGSADSEEGPLDMNDFPLDDEAGAEMDMDVDMESGTEDSESMDEKVSFRLIQKLTGKLTQKVRALESQDGMTSEDIKYVINMVLSSLDLTKLSPEDMEDVMSKFEDVEAGEEMGMEGGEEMPSDEMNVDMEVDMQEPTEGAGHIFDSLFKESKVDRFLSKYFEVSDKEKNQLQKLHEERKQEKMKLVSDMVNKITRFAVSESQKLAGAKFLEENTSFKFVGRTNKNNLVFENKEKQVKVSPEGIVL
jgi:hypothetical protein